MLANGEGGPADLAGTRQLYAAAAAQGHALAQCRLGMMLADPEGCGGPPDAAEARRRFGVETEETRAAAVAVADAAAAARAAAAKVAAASARVSAHERFGT